MTTPLMILIAGPYRSGTDDDPDLLAANLRGPRGGGLADLPGRARADDRRVGGAAGDARRRLDRVGDPVSEQVLYPTAERLLQHCDAVLRLPGASTGADQDVRIAEERGLPVFTRVEDIPGYVAA